jgi:hypothetical protein
MSTPEEPKLYGNQEGTAEEAPSQALLPVAVPTLLLLCAAGPDLDAVCAIVIRSGVRPVHVPRVELAPPAENAPRHCFIDLDLPGASAYLQALAKSPDTFPVAIVSPHGDAAKAFRLGAIATLQRPLLPELVEAIITGQRQRILQRKHSSSTTGAFQRPMPSKDCFAHSVRT